MAFSKQKKARGRHPNKKSLWTNVTVFLRIFRSKKDFQWNGNEIHCANNAPLAERIGILRTCQQDKVKAIKKAVGQFAKEFSSAKLECEAVFLRPFFGKLKPIQVDTNLKVEQDKEYTLILYMTD